MKKKNKLNEEQLIAEANLWFQQKYGRSPKECGVEFVKIWHIPTLLLFSRTTVVFASNEDKGTSFIKEQNNLLITLSSLVIFGVYFFISIFLCFYFIAQDNLVGAKITAITFVVVLICFLVYTSYLSIRCNKLEKSHNWDVDIYYPQI